MPSNYSEDEGGDHYNDGNIPLKRIGRTFGDPNEVDRITEAWNRTKSTAKEWRWTQACQSRNYGWESSSVGSGSATRDMEGDTTGRVTKERQQQYHQLHHERVHTTSFDNSINKKQSRETGYNDVNSSNDNWIQRVQGSGSTNLSQRYRNNQHSSLPVWASRDYLCEDSPDDKGEDTRDPTSYTHTTGRGFNPYSASMNSVLRDSGFVSDGTSGSGYHQDHQRRQLYFNNNNNNNGQQETRGPTGGRVGWRQSSNVYYQQQQYENIRKETFHKTKNDSGNFHKTNNDSRNSNLRRRREKYMPPWRRECELFDHEEQISAGQYFVDSNSLESEIDISGGDGSTPLIRTFDECTFYEAIHKNIQLKNYIVPTLIQKSVIPIIMQKKQYDLIGHAQTGSGKTAAFLLPIINEIQTLKEQSYHGVNEPFPYAIVIAPTRELAQQLFNDARAFSVGTNVAIAHSYGDMPMGRSVEEVRQGCDLFIATCGRLQHFVGEGIVGLNRLQYLILDEADRLIGSEFSNTIAFLKTNSNINQNHRTLMFSATFDERIQVTAVDLLRENFFFIRIGQLNAPAETVDQRFIEVQRYSKLDALKEMLKSVSKVKPKANGDFHYETLKTLVFVNEKRASDRIAIALCHERFLAQSLNADRTMKQRSEAVLEFTRGQFHVLVATDVAARGLNFPNVSTVFNYDLPERDDVTYIHRIGRTGRAGNIGNSISFFDQDSINDLRNAKFYLQTLEMSGADVPPFLREIVANGVMSMDAEIPIDATQMDENTLQERVLNENLPSITEEFSVLSGTVKNEDDENNKNTDNTGAGGGNEEISEPLLIDLLDMGTNNAETSGGGNIRGNPNFMDYRNPMLSPATVSTFKTNVLE